MDYMQMRQSYVGNDQGRPVSIRERDTGEFQEVVSRYLPLFYNRAYRYLGDAHEAEDAVQDALLAAYRHLDQFKGASKMATWLTTIVSNCALTQLRRKARQPSLSLDERATEEQEYSLADRLADVRATPEEEYVQSELHEHLMQFVADLSPSLRTAIQLRDLEGMTTSEAARFLGIPEGTIKARLSRARSKLKWLMSRGVRRRRQYR